MNKRFKTVVVANEQMESETMKSDYENYNLISIVRQDKDNVALIFERNN